MRKSTDHRTLDQKLSFILVRVCWPTHQWTGFHSCEAALEVWGFLKHVPSLPTQPVNTKRNTSATGHTWHQASHDINAQVSNDIRATGFTWHQHCRASMTSVLQISHDISTTDLPWHQHYGSPMTNRFPMISTLHVSNDINATVLQHP